MARIRKAEQAEKMHYASTGPLHPLYGYITVNGVMGGTKGRWSCAVEYLGEGRDNPNYEVMAPNGLLFSPDYIHTLLASTLAEMYERLKYQRLALCPYDCDCKLSESKAEADERDAKGGK